MSLFDTLFKLAMPKGLADHTLYRNFPYKQTILHKLGQLLEDGRIDAVLYHELSGIFASDKISYAYSNDEKLPYINIFMKFDSMILFFFMCCSQLMLCGAGSYIIIRNGLDTLLSLETVLVAVFTTLIAFYALALIFFFRRSDEIILQDRLHFILEKHFQTDGKDGRALDIFIRKKARKHKDKIFLDFDNQEFLKQVRMLQQAPRHQKPEHSQDNESLHN